MLKLRRVSSLRQRYPVAIFDDKCTGTRKRMRPQLEPHGDVPPVKAFDNAVDACRSLCALMSKL